MQYVQRLDLYLAIDLARGLHLTVHAQEISQANAKQLFVPARRSFSEKEGKVCYHIINHLKLTFVASKPLLPRIAYQEVLMAAEASAEYFL